MKITQAQGEGHGRCKLCKENGKFTMNWMCFLWKIEGKDGVYCKDCVDKILKDTSNIKKG